MSNAWFSISQYRNSIQTASRLTHTHTHTYLHVDRYFPSSVWRFVSNCVENVTSTHCHMTQTKCFAFNYFHLFLLWFSIELNFDWLLKFIAREWTCVNIVIDFVCCAHCLRRMVTIVTLQEIRKMRMRNTLKSHWSKNGTYRRLCVHRVRPQFWKIQSKSNQSIILLIAHLSWDYHHIFVHSRYVFPTIWKTRSEHAPDSCYFCKNIERATGFNYSTRKSIDYKTR